MAASAGYSIELSCEFCLPSAQYLILFPRLEQWYQRWSWEGVCILGSIRVQEKCKKGNWKLTQVKIKASKSLFEGRPMIFWGHIKQMGINMCCYYVYSLFQQESPASLCKQYNFVSKEQFPVWWKALRTTLQ